MNVCPFPSGAPCALRTSGAQHPLNAQQFTKRLPLKWGSTRRLL